MVSMGARSKSMGMLSTSNPEGVTIVSSVGLMNLNADISAMAGYLAMSVPFIAIALVKGVGSFVHMASHLGNVSQGAATQAAGDAVSGNYNFGNISEGNHQVANTNMLSQSHAASYRAGSFQFVDGRTDMTTMGDGSQIVNIGTSNLPVSINKAETDTAQFSEMATQNYQKSLNFSQSSAKSIGDSYRQMVDLSQNLAKSESVNDGVTQGISAEQSSAIHQGAQLVKRFADNNQISTDKAAQILGSITAGVGEGFFIKASLNGQASVSASDQELLQKAKEFTKDQNFQQATREATQASATLSHTLSDEASRRMAEGVSGSFEKGIQQREDALKSYQEAESFTQQAMNTKANATSINALHNQQFIEWLAAQPSDNSTGHIGYRGAADIIARQPSEATAWGNKYLSEQGLNSQISLHTNSTQIKESYTVEKGHQAYVPTSDSLEAVKKQGSTTFTKDISKDGAALKEDTSKYIDNSKEHIDERSESVIQQGSKMESKVKDQQGRYVIKRVGDKFYKEGKEIYEDLKNLKNGEPQQK
jgi:conjugal transfer mating pair stabilization protein TraG